MLYIRKWRIGPTLVIKSHKFLILCNLSLTCVVIVFTARSSVLNLFFLTNSANDFTMLDPLQIFNTPDSTPKRALSHCSCYTIIICLTYLLTPFADVPAETKAKAKATKFGLKAKALTLPVCNGQMIGRLHSGMTQMDRQISERVQ